MMHVPPHRHHEYQKASRSTRPDLKTRSRVTSDPGWGWGLTWVTSYPGRIGRGRYLGKERVYDMQEVIEGEHACG